MMTYEDEPIIKRAITRRLHEDGKTEIAAIEVQNFPDAKPPYIKVGIWLILKDRLGAEGLLDIVSHFELPASFYHSHLLNEIDQIAEQMKEMRSRTVLGSPVFRPGARQPREALKGTGLRGLWPQ